MTLYHLNSAFTLVDTLYGIEVNSDTFEDLALSAWELIGNKHTRLYRYIGDTSNQELKLPCNVTDIESVHIPVVDAQITDPAIDYGNIDAVFTELYIDAWAKNKDPFYNKGKLVKYKDGGDRLYFTRDYKRVMVVYHGVQVDSEDGLPMINEKEMKAIAAFIAYTETFKDALRRKDKNSLVIAQTLKEEWLRRCNAARIPNHLSQNDMNSILDCKFRMDHKYFGKSLKPII